MTWANVVNALIGVWFIIAPFVLAFTNKTAETWTSVIGGIVLLVLAGSAALSKKALLRSRGSSQSPLEIIAALDFIGMVLLPLAGALALSKVTRKRTWVQYVNAIVGIWFIVAPYVLRFALNPLQRWSSVVGGVITLALSGWLAFGVLPKTRSGDDKVRSREVSNRLK